MALATSTKCSYCFTVAVNECKKCSASTCGAHTDEDGTCLDVEDNRVHGKLTKAAAAKAKKTAAKTKKEKKMDNEKEPFDAKKPDAPGSGDVSDKATTEAEARGEQEIPAEQAPSPADRTDKAGTPEEPLTGQPFDVDERGEGSDETDPEKLKQDAEDEDSDADKD